MIRGLLSILIFLTGSKNVTTPSTRFSGREKNLNYYKYIMNQYFVIPSQC